MNYQDQTWCPQCRMVRRLAWQGYRFLYKRKCDFSGELVLSTIPPEAPYKVYKQDVWWSDKWDAKSYGREYDFNLPFFEQLKELMHEVPMPSLMTEYTTMVGSDYCNAASTLKNCYLCFKFDESEECAYCNTCTNIMNSFDISFANFCELCYESTNITKCYQTFFSQDCEDCHDVWFSRDLVGCTNCVGCINLRNKNYHIFNQPYSKQEYEKMVATYGFDSARDIEDFKKKVETFIVTQPRRQFHGYKNQDVSGDYLYNCKNVKDSFMVRNSENLRYCQMLKAGPAYNCMDYNEFAVKAEWVYESKWVGIQTNNVKFSVWAYKNHDIECCFGCMGSGNLFGCVGIRSGEYCILNKQYSKEEYTDLIAKIKDHMMKMPYIDKLGREYRYGEMLPIELCPWPYNETNAYEWIPMKKEETFSQGYAWRDPDKREWGPATDTILKCEDCGRNYLTIQKELQFYERFNLPIPSKCPMCRELIRIRQLNPIAIYDRTCDKCQKAIETSYAPDRPEVVYCESCYQQEAQ